MKWSLLVLCALLLVVPALAEEPSPTPSATPDSVVAGGYTALETPTPVPTPEPPPLRDDPMLQNVVEIAHRIDILAENERFINYFTYGSIRRDQIEKLTYGDHTRPAQAFHLSGETLIDALHAGAEPEQMLDFTRPELQWDLVNELPEILWGRQEELDLAILALLARYKVFALEGAEGCGLFLLLYDEAAPVIVTWAAQQECVCAAAFFMPDETLANASTTEDVSTWFASAGMPVVTFEEVPLT